MGKNQFVVKHGDKWAVVGANNERATRITDTQKEAIALQGILQLISSLKCEFKIEMENGANVIVMVMIRVRLRTKIINIAKLIIFWQ